MFSLIINGIDYFNPVKNNIHLFVDAFVEVLGEKYKKQIETNLNNTQFFFPIINAENLERKIFELFQSELKNCNNSKQIQNIKDKYKPILDKLDKHRINVENNDYNKDFKLRQIVDEGFEKVLKSHNVKISDLSINEINSNRTTYGNFINNIYELKNNKQELPEIIKQQYENLFLLLGYEKQEKFEDYLKDEYLTSNIYDKSVVDEKEMYDKLLSSMDNIATYVLNKDIMEEFNNLDIVNFDENKQIFTDYLTGENLNRVAYCQNQLTKNQELKLFLVNKIDCLNLKTLIHEMGHAIDSQIIKKENLLVLKSGLKELKYDENYETRSAIIPEILSKYGLNFENYDLFNEIINEYIVIKVTKKFIKKNKKFNKIFGNKLSDSIYMNGFDVLSEFLKTHFEKIIELKMSNNILDTINYFGAENLVKIINITSEYTKQKTLVDNDIQLFTPDNMNENQLLENKKLYLESKKQIDKINDRIIEKNK